MSRGDRLGLSKRLIAGLAIVAIAVSACGSSDTATAPDKLEEVIAAGKVRVGDCLSFAPFGFIDETGKPAGYDVDIATEMAAQLGVELEMVDTTADNRIPNLQTDKVDVVICNFTENPVRAKQINFTIPYVIAGEVLLVKKDSDINGICDLDGKTVAVVTGSTNAEIIAAANPNAITAVLSDLRGRGAGGQVRPGRRDGRGLELPDLPGEARPDAPRHERLAHPARAQRVRRGPGPARTGSSGRTSSSSGSTTRARTASSTTSGSAWSRSGRSSSRRLQASSDPHALDRLKLVRRRRPAVPHLVS